MLEHFSIENFKGYEGRYDFDFPGLTFLTGANNSGKSSIIQALYMLASSNSNNFYATLLTNTTNYNYGGFKDLLNKNCRSTDNIKFDLCWEDLNMSVKYGNNEIENYNPVIEKLKISYKDKKGKYKDYIFKLSQENSDENDDYGRNYDLYTIHNKKEKSLGKSFIYGLTPDIHIRGFKDVDIDDIFKLRFLFRNLNTNCIKYLKAYREEAKKTYRMQGTSIYDIGVAGEYTAEAIYKMSQGNKYISFGNKVLFLECFQHWFKKIIGNNYSLLVEAPENMLRMKIIEDLSTSDISRSQKYDITEVGFGFSQIIPIITMILLSNKNDILLIENPEVHLHPKLQANLADLFVFAVKHDRKLIIETHSEHIINRTRTLIKQDENSKKLLEKVNIYFFEKNFTNGECSINNQEITIDEIGQLSKWPKDFFDQSYTENLKLIKY